MSDAEIGQPSRIEVGALPEFGVPEAQFRPSPRQTTLGIAAGILIGTAAMIWTLVVGRHPAGRVGPANEISGGRVIVALLFQAAGMGLSYWFWRLRKWKLLLCPGGVVQIGAWGQRTISWSEVVEVVETRQDKPDGPLVGVCLVGRNRKLKVGTVNYRSAPEMFQTVLEAVRRRSIPIRVKVEDTN